MKWWASCWNCSYWWRSHGEMFYLVRFQLLEKKKRVQLKDMGEDLECLCQIMRTVGPRLDHEKAKVWKIYNFNNTFWVTVAFFFSPSTSCFVIVKIFHLQSLMNQYFSRMRSLMNNKDLPARIRFLLQDTVELRENNWVPRKAFIDNGPKTINQIRQDAVKVRAPIHVYFILLFKQQFKKKKLTGESLSFCFRIWVCLFQLWTQEWGLTSFKITPSCQHDWAGRFLGDWLICLDKCQVYTDPLVCVCVRSVSDLAFNISSANVEGQFHIDVGHGLLESTQQGATVTIPELVWLFYS